jgi:hypothetical protein
VLRAYLKRWKAEVWVLFQGVGPGSTEEQIPAIAGEAPGLQGAAGGLLRVAAR